MVVEVSEIIRVVPLYCSVLPDFALAFKLQIQLRLPNELVEHLPFWIRMLLFLLRRRRFGPVYVHLLSVVFALELNSAKNVKENVSLQIIYQRLIANEFSNFDPVLLSSNCLYQA